MHEDGKKGGPKGDRRAHTERDSRTHAPPCKSSRTSPSPPIPSRKKKQSGWDGMVRTPASFAPLGPGPSVITGPGGRDGPGRKKRSVRFVGRSQKGEASRGDQPAPTAAMQIKKKKEEKRKTKLCLDVMVGRETRTNLPELLFALLWLRGPLQPIPPSLSSFLLSHTQSRPPGSTLQLSSNQTSFCMFRSSAKGRRRQARKASLPAFISGPWKAMCAGR